MELLKGYRTLTPAEVALANQVKSVGEMLGHVVEKLRSHPDIDQRWVSIGATDLQTGIMALVRSITRPTTF